MYVLPSKVWLFHGPWHHMGLTDCYIQTYVTPTGNRELLCSKRNLASTSTSTVKGLTLLCGIWVLYQLSLEENI